MPKTESINNADQLIKEHLDKRQDVSDRAKIEFVGRLDQGKPDRSVFIGSISTDERLKSGQLTEADLNRLEKEVPLFMTEAQPGGRVRCIDGRILHTLLQSYLSGDYEAFKAQLERPLGFETPGGVPYMGLAYRIANGHIEDHLSFDEDMEHVAKSLIDQHFPFIIGGHIDNHSKLPNTGCGAIDQVPTTLQVASDPSAISRLFELSQALAYPDIWDEEYFDIAIGRVVRLQGCVDKYLLKTEAGDYAYKQRAIEIVHRMSQTEDDNMPPLAGKHQEDFAVVNKIKGMTFNTDLFYLANMKTNGSQAFGWDLWSSRLMGEFFYPDDDQKAKMYFHTRLILGVAALMVLTDGSQRVIKIGIPEEA